MNFGESIREYFNRPLVRPWAMSGPILVLLICLPLLRPIRHPDPRQMSDDEMARLATVQAIGENHTLAIDNTLFAGTRYQIKVGEKHYSSILPVQSALLGECYWVLKHAGLSFQENPTLVEFWLTLLGVTLPVALSAGLVYRMGRIFELPRQLRAALGGIVVLGSGLISYGVVLNSHAPAATFLLLTVTCLMHMARTPHPLRSFGWLFVAGLCAGLAGVVDETALLFSVLLMFVIFGMRWSSGLRIGGVLLYLIGAMPAVALHAALCVPVTGDLLPGKMHPELQSGPPVANSVYMLSVEHSTSTASELLNLPVVEDEPGSWSQDLFAAIGQSVGKILETLFGSHGLLSHFPVVIVGLLGAGMVLHRHWSSPTKMLAVIAMAGGGIVIVFYSLVPVDVGGEMFASRWAIVFLPFALFWSGVWLRKKHRPQSWIFAGVALGFSVLVSLIGATDPCPQQGYGDYTVIQTLKHMVHPEVPVKGKVLVGR